MSQVASVFIRHQGWPWPWLLWYAHPSGGGRGTQTHKQEEAQSVSRLHGEHSSDVLETAVVTWTKASEKVAFD